MGIFGGGYDAPVDTAAEVVKTKNEEPLVDPEQVAREADAMKAPEDDEQSATSVSRKLLQRPTVSTVTI